MEGRVRSVVGLPLQWEEFVTFVRRETVHPADKVKLTVYLKSVFLRHHTVPGQSRPDQALGKYLFNGYIL